MPKTLQTLLSLAATALVLHPHLTSASAIPPHAVELAPRESSSSSSSSSSNPGVDLVNAGSSQQTYYFCENASNGDGEADPGFTSGSTSSLSASSSELPSGCSKIATSVSVGPSQTAAVSLDLSFKGRVVRTTDTPATWVELQIQSDTSGCTEGSAFCGWGWGDVSLEMGCDGAATVAPADGSGDAVGYTTPADLVDKAPSAATTTRSSDGVKVITAPWYDGTVLNQAAADYLYQNVPGDNTMAYINVTSGTTQAVATNNRFLVTFY